MNDELTPTGDQPDTRGMTRETAVLNMLRRAVANGFAVTFSAEQIKLVLEACESPSQELDRLRARVAELEREVRDERDGRLLHEGVEDSWRRKCLAARQRIAELEAALTTERERLSALAGLIPCEILLIRESECRGDYVEISPNNGKAVEGKTLAEALDPARRSA